MNLVCKSCGGKINDGKENYDMFEGMHWLCFHLAFEHHTDPDEPCDSRLCPVWHLKILRKHIEKTGQNPEKIINAEVEKQWASNAKNKKLT